MPLLEAQPDIMRFRCLIRTTLALKSLLSCISMDRVTSGRPTILPIASSEKKTTLFPCSQEATETLTERTARVTSRGTLA